MSVFDDGGDLITAPVAFRAGSARGEPAFAAAPLKPHPALLLPGVVLMADASEWNPDINDAVYVANFSKAIIIRAAYGDAHDDRAWYDGARRDALHAAGIRFLGIYQYIIAGQSITAQAQAFCRLIGKPRPGEYYIADIEEGAGSLQATWQTWVNVVSGTLGLTPRTTLGNYSGLNFAAAHNLSPVDWVAAYGTAEPSVPHLFWQFTDALAVPGIPGHCDCSVFHGSIDTLASLAYAGQQPAPSPLPTPSPLTWKQIMAQVPVVQQGDTGEVVRTVQGLCGARHHPTPVDGSFGAGTKTAVEAVQQDAKAHDPSFGVDGIVGPRTWLVLAGV